MKGYEFSGTPDATVFVRNNYLHSRSTNFVVVEDKSFKASGTAEYQLPGVFIAVAVNNYMLLGHLPQTIFGMRVKGNIVFYLMYN